MCELLTSTLVTLLDDVTGKNKQQEQAPFLPYSLSNQTGVVVRYGRMGTGAVHEHLVPGEEASFDLWGSEDTRNVMCSAEGPPPRSLVVACDGWSWAADVPLHRVGERTIEVTSLAQPQLTQRLVCEVGLQADRKVLTLRSSTRLINETRVPLEVRHYTSRLFNPNPNPNRNPNPNPNPNPNLALTLTRCACGSPTRAWRRSTRSLPMARCPCRSGPTTARTASTCGRS